MLQSGCNQLQALLYARGLVSRDSEESQNTSRSRNIEKSLYCSCVKAERYVTKPQGGTDDLADDLSELRIELQLPSTGRIKYFDLFPSLSFPVTSDIQTIDGSAHIGTPTRVDALVAHGVAV